MIAIVDKLGKIVKLISCPLDMVELNTPEECSAIIDGPDTLDFWYKDGDFIKLPRQPSPDHVFNYSTGSWELTLTLQHLKEVKWDAVKLERTRFENSGFIYDSRVFDSDAEARSRITSMIVTERIQWQARDNTQVTLSASDWESFKMALSSHMQLAHDKAQYLRKKIFAASSVDDFPDIVFS